MTEPRSAPDVADRIARQNWPELIDHLASYGWGVIRRVLDASECGELAAVYDDAGLFRSHIIMARHGFGQGEYRYFGYPLPPLIDTSDSVVDRD